MASDLYRATALIIWHPRPDGTEQAVIFEPGYSDTVPHRYGKHGMDIRWVLRGPRGAACFLLNTGWVPGEKGISRRISDLFPMASDLGYHARAPQYDGQDERDYCEYLDGPCYYDGSGLAADDILPRFIRDGESVIWAALEERYADIRTEGEAS